MRKSRKLFSEREKGERERQREREREIAKTQAKQREKKHGTDFPKRCRDENIAKGSPSFCKKGRFMQKVEKLLYEFRKFTFNDN